MRISDWSSDVCSSDLHEADHPRHTGIAGAGRHLCQPQRCPGGKCGHLSSLCAPPCRHGAGHQCRRRDAGADWRVTLGWRRSEEHTSELQSLMRTSYAVFCLKKKKSLAHDNKRARQLTSNTTRTTICTIYEHKK